MRHAGRNAWRQCALGGALVAGLSGLCGCIGAPGIPGGPLQGTGVTFSGAYGYALAPARVTLQSTATGRRSSFRDAAGDAMNIPFLPSRLGGRVGITDWFDAAADLSMLDSGLELRAGLPEGTEPFPVALALGVRRGSWGVLERENRFSTEQRLRLEAYPRLAELRYIRLNLISSLGVSTGRRYHPFYLPNRFQPYDDSSEGFPGPTLDPQLLREETRLELSAGLELRQRRFFASIVLMPYLVTGAHQLTGSCGQCGEWQVQSYESRVGASLFISAGVTFNSGKHDPEHAQR